jgi:hypothetical protein
MQLPALGKMIESTVERLRLILFCATEKPLGVKPGRDSPEIRVAASSDATKIAHVRREAILSKAITHYDEAIVNAWADATDLAERVDQIEHAISDPGHIVLIAEIRGEMLGFAIADLPASELQALYVKPNPFGGVGGALLAALEDRAFATIPFLSCDASLNAQDFYKANGYVEESRKDFVMPRGLVSRVVRMKKQSRRNGPPS